VAEDAEDFDGIATVDAGGKGGVAFDDGPASILNDADVESDGVGKGDGFVFKDGIAKADGVFELVVAGGP